MQKVRTLYVAASPADTVSEAVTIRFAKRGKVVKHGQ